MRINDFINAKEEPEVLPQLSQYLQNNLAQQSQVNSADINGLQQQSAALGRVYRLAPHLEPGVILALAKSNASDQTIAKVGQAAIAVQRQKADELAEQEKKNRGLFSKVYGKFKTGLRWGVAVADTGFDLLNQVPSSVMSPSENPRQGDVLDFDPKNPFRKGWWASTALGSMMSGEESGEGFFIGGSAGELQQRRLNQFAGQIPITIEAGAAENTAYEPRPEEIRQLAMQLIADRGLSFEEAYEEAKTIIRSNATIPVTVAGTSPLWFPKPTTLKTPTGGTLSTGIPEVAGFQDIGSSDYAMTAAMATLALGFASPDPVSKVWKGVAKPLLTYARGIDNIDEAGNFVMDTRNIAQTREEAEFLSRVDSLNAIVNDYEVSALRLQDEAIENATPQPGVWYHGSRGGPIPDNTFFDIGDPRYPTPEGNLYGPGLYITESPLIGQTYARSLATREITEAEEATLRSIPGAGGDRNIQLGLPVEELDEGVPPAAVYRFIDSKDMPEPRLIDMDRPLGLADGIDVPQMTPEEIDELANIFVPRSLLVEDSNYLPALLPEGDSLSELFSGLDINKTFSETRDGIIKWLNTIKGGSHSVDTRLSQVFERLRFQANEIAKSKPEIFESSSFVAPVVTTKRMFEFVRDFVNEFGRWPNSVDELLDFRGARNNIDELFFSPGADSVEFLKGSSIQDIAQQLILRGNDAVVGPLGRLSDVKSPALHVYESYLYTARNVAPNSNWDSIVGEVYGNPAFGYKPENMEVLQQFFDNVILPKIDESFELRLGDNPALRALVEKHQNLGAWSSWQYFFIGDIADELGTGKIPYLTINQKLSSMGFDGLTHMGGFIAGAEKPHRVRILFDPMKNLDVTDPLTAERLPINDAINAQRESGELYMRAAEVRTKIDEMRMEERAGIIPGYGPWVEPEKFNTFFTQSRAGRYAADKIWEVVERFKDYGGADNWYELFTMFNGRIPLEDLEEILKAKSKAEMVGIINQKVGYTPGLSNIDDLNFSLSKTFDKLKRVSRMDALFDKVEDIFGPVMKRSPKSKHLNFFGTEREKLQALQDLDAFMTTGVRGEIVKEIKLPYGTVTEKNRILRKFAEAMMSGNRTDMFEASQLLGKAIYQRILSETGDAEQARLASDLWSSVFDQASGQGLYNVGKEGLRVDNNYAVSIAEDMWETNPSMAYKLEESVHSGPGLLSELQQSPLELPDVQALRRMTSLLGVFTGKQGLQRAIKKSELRTNILKKVGIDLSEKDLTKIGELRIPLRATEFLMTRVWKNFKKLSFGYAVRNTMEAQARLAMAGKDNIFTHPIDHILVSTFNRIPDDIALGEEFNPGGWRNIGVAHEGAGAGYQEMLGNAFFASEGRFDMATSQFRTRAFDVFSKDKPTNWAKAGAYELRQLFNDPISRRMANGADVDMVMKWLYSDSEEAQKALREIENMMRSGEVFRGKGFGGAPENIPVEPTPLNIRKRIEAMQKARLELKTGGDPALMEIVATGRMDGMDVFDPKGNPSRELLDYLESNIDSEMLPTFYKGPGESTVLMASQQGWFDQAVRFVFDNLVGRVHNQLDRSPLWRQEYTQEINRLAPLLSKEAAAEMIDIITERTEFYNTMAKTKKIARTFTMQDYVGRNVDAEELLDSLNNADGWMSREELHIIANSLTLDRIENFLFDATARNSFTDAARIVSPFNAAFFEVTKTWFRKIAENPDKLIKVTQKFGHLSGQKSPEELGPNGIIHKDPVTGEYMYSLPMSGTIARLFNRIVGGADTGADYSLQAPVKGLNMAFNFTPGFSPVVGYPLGKLLYSSPKLRDYAALFLPYGQPKSPLDPMEYAPGWLSKAISAAVNDPRQATTYADTLNDVIRAELATGKWNIEDPEEYEEFQNDAERKAVVLTMMRSIGQFIGPASPRLKVQVQTKSGDVMAGFLTAEFHELQSQDYNTAVENFLYMFGEEAFAYMAGKTREVYLGTEANSEFARWELENAELFDSAYGEIAGFFGPKGSDFDWSAWNYQFNTGKRVRMPYQEQVATAQQIIGLHKYRQIVQAAGPKPNQAQRDFIAAQKAALEQQYPGMVSQSTYDVQKFPRQIKLMEQAIADPRLADNEVAIQLRKYLDIRNMYITAAENVGGWNSQRATPLRADLRYRASLLMEETPAFSRIFERVLLNELER